MSYYPISGAVIKKIFPDKNDVKLYITLPGNSTEYIILHEYNDNKKHFFSKGDLLYCVLSPDVLGQLRFVRLPRVILGRDKNTLISFFLPYTKDNWSKAQAIYYKIVVWANGDNNVFEYLCNMSERYKYFIDRNADMHLSQIIECSQKDAGKLLNSWYHQKILRELYLLTLTMEEIEKSHLRTSIFKQILLTNPFRICSITAEKAQHIADCLNINCSNDDKTNSFIQKIIYDKINGSGWTSMKIDMLESKVGIISSERRKKLETDYFLFFDEFTNCVYFDFTYKNEIDTANFLLNLRKNDPFDYDISREKSFMFKGNYIQAIEPVLTRSDYTNDQIKAITGAINHRFSIITGAAGTGKCLAKGTLIRSFNGNLISVEKLKIGDKLLGYQGEIRKVLDLGKGIDMLYKIKPKYGNSFVCNGDHLLTVKSSTNNIYEISVTEYIKSSPQNVYLFHQKINYPKQPLINKLTKDFIPDDYLYNESKIVDETIDFFFENSNICIANTEEIAIQLEYACLSRGYSCIRSKKYLTLNKEHSLISSFTVEEQGEGEYYGFTLDGDGRFLLADYTVTHNTTIVREIYENLLRISRQTLICSFMGKAVSRVREVMGSDVNASTIHSAIIQIKLARSKAIKEKNDKFAGPEHIIIDEASTLSSDLFHEFITAFFDVKYLTFVGDVNQLEPIQYGFPMKSIILARLFPVYYLSTNHRLYNSDGKINGVAVNALFIAERDDEASDFDFTENEDFIILNGNANTLISLLEELHRKEIPVQELVVITPYNRYLKNINNFLQILYNGNSNGIIDKFGNNWKIGDRIMLLQNCDSIKIYNGDEFIITNIKNIERILIIQKKYEYGTKEFQVFVDASIEYDEEGNVNILTTNLFTLSYCITVDKSQGSEYNYVIYYIPMNDDIKDSCFLYRNRSYVAVSRTRKKCYLVGNYVLHLASCIRNSKYRHDNLTLRMVKNRGDLQTLELYVSDANQDIIEDDFPDDSGINDFDEDYS